MDGIPADEIDDDGDEIGTFELNGIPGGNHKK